jgi:N-acetylmuramoyl-L-alanine amidase
MKRFIAILSTSTLVTAAICFLESTQSNTTVITQTDLTAVQSDTSSKDDKNVHCLALNIYHEARSDSKLGQEAVALVTMNRRESKRYPNTVCDVVYQSKLDSNGNPIKHKCQFSWFCDGKSDKTLNSDKWIEALEVATYVYNGYGSIRDITDGALMYHADYVKPYWKKHYTKTSRIDSHIFYK